jgi:hypothetical protein
MGAKIPHRCSRCFARHSFRFHWKTYAKSLRCRRCGSESFYIDKRRASRGATQNCYCDGYFYPHRRGSRCCRNGGSNPLGLVLDPDWSDGGVELSDDPNDPF